MSEIRKTHRESGSFINLYLSVCHTELIVSRTIKSVNAFNSLNNPGWKQVKSDGVKMCLLLVLKREEFSRSITFRQLLSLDEEVEEDR